MDAIAALVKSDGISSTRALRLLGFLALEEAGMADAVLDRKAVVQLRREARKLGLARGGLAVEADAVAELDTRALIAELAGSFA